MAYQSDPRPVTRMSSAREERSIGLELMSEVSSGYHAIIRLFRLSCSIFLSFLSIRTVVLFQQEMSFNRIVLPGPRWSFDDNTTLT